MSISYELLETFTGTRDLPDVMEEDEILTVSCRNIKVLFTMGEVEHERMVNVVFDEEGEYDHEATLARIEQVMMGVENKINLGVIT